MCASVHFTFVKQVEIIDDITNKHASTRTAKKLWQENTQALVSTVREDCELQLDVKNRTIEEQEIEIQVIIFDSRA